MKYNYRDGWYTIQELADMSGIAPPTIRDRLRRGYSLEQAISLSPVKESVLEFNNASYWNDWVGMSSSYLYEIYWKWCVSNGYQPESKQCLSRQLISMHPQLKIIPMRDNENHCNRYIRLRG